MADKWMSAVSHRYFFLLVTENISYLTEQTHCVSFIEKELQNHEQCKGLVQILGPKKPQGPYFIKLK